MTNAIVGWSVGGSEVLAGEKEIEEKSVEECESKEEHVLYSLQSGPSSSPESQSGCESQTFSRARQRVRLSQGKPGSRQATTGSGQFCRKQDIICYRRGIPAPGRPPPAADSSVGNQTLSVGTQFCRKPDILSTQACRKPEILNIQSCREQHTLSTQSCRKPLTFAIQSSAGLESQRICQRICDHIY